MVHFAHAEYCQEPHVGSEAHHAGEHHAHHGTDSRIATHEASHHPHHFSHHHSSEHHRGEFAQRGPHREPRHLVRQHLQRPRGRYEVGNRERQREAHHAERPIHRHGQHDVDEVLEQVDHEGCARIAVGVETAEHEQVEREPEQPYREAAECTAGVQRCHLVEVAVLHDHADDRSTEHEHASGSGQGEQCDES